MAAFINSPAASSTTVPPPFPTTSNPNTTASLTKVCHYRKRISEEGYSREPLSNFLTVTLVYRYLRLPFSYLYLKFNFSLLLTTIDENERMVSVPVCGSVGFVLAKKTSPPSSKQYSNSWVTKATFQDITYWNHDYVPSHNDEMLRAFHWLTVAKAVSLF